MSRADIVCDQPYSFRNVAFSSINQEWAADLKT